MRARQERLTGRPGPASRPPTSVGPLRWTAHGELILADQAGTWYLADPVTTRVKALAAALKGKEQVTFSPDGKQVIYSTPGKSGPQWWQATAEGSSPRLLGENVLARWDEATGAWVVGPLVQPGVKARLSRESRQVAE